jgi:carbon-monoxide dehydrogenase large subunit
MTDTQEFAVRADSSQGKDPLPTSDRPGGAVAVDNKPKLGIGARLPRKEDARHLRGRGQFVSDLKFPRTQEVAFVRSPIAHGYIRAIYVPPEVRAQVFLSSDLPEILPITSICDIPGWKQSVCYPLVRDRVRFVGQPVAACVARTRAEAEDIAQSVIVEYDELRAVNDALRALEPDAPLLYEEWGDNLYIRKDFDAGDIQSARDAADVVVKREFRMNRQAGVPMEGRAILAFWDDRLDELTVYNSTQHPHQIRVGLAYFLQMPERQIHVIAPDVGGGFGVKNILYPEELVVAALGRRLRHPVRWIDDRREHLLTATHAREHLYRITAYADARGKILGLEAEIYVDAGAHAHWPNSHFMETGMAAKNLPGPYQIRNYRAATYTVATNKSPMGPYRGVARPGACFAIERTIDEVARAVGREPHEVRMENMVTSAMMPYRSITNLVFDNGDYALSVAKAAQLIDLPAIRRRQESVEPDNRLIGVGFASYTEQTAHGCGEWVTRGSPIIPGFESATARLMTDGTLVLLVGIQSHGQGLETTLSQVAHEELGIDPQEVSVRHGDTAVSPFGMGTFASRSMVMSGGAVARACRLLREKMAHIGAYLLQCSPQEITLADGCAHGRGASISFAEIGRIAHLRQDSLPRGIDPILEVVTTYSPGIDTGVFCYCTQVAVVAVDPEDGAVELLDYGVVEDCGTMVNPMIVEGQIVGGVVQGIGTALFEEIPYDDNGQPLATTFADYLMPTAPEIPDIRIVHMVTPSAFTEYGMKGMGEGGAISPPAAIANAVRDALSRIGAEVNETPITPRRVRAAIVAAGRKGTAG